ncbi:MAG TPA: fasciclin domain-containing protein [Chitinophagaceae bacterium]|nr:fasciclin domain-containing protein [Chitinophagaceae bacterium]
MNLRNRFFGYSRTALILSSVALLAVACNKDDDENDMGSNTSTITDVVVGTDAFSTLEAGVVKANLQSTLSGTGPFTVFAPDNAAFTASGITSDLLNSLSADQVKTILLYHTLSGKVMAADVPAGPNAKVTTASGDSVFVTRNGNGVFVNGVKVEQADIAASNGVIHRIGRVLQPPVGSIVATAAAAGSGFDSLVKAVTRANNTAGGDPTLLATLSNATLTVFAPTNSAFTQLLTALNLTDINQIPVATLLAVLRYHVVPGRVFSSDLANGNVTMLAGGTTTVNLTNGTNGAPTITGSGNGENKSNIVAANVMARNGVVHVIDRVLIP